MIYDPRVSPTRFIIAKTAQAFNLRPEEMWEYDQRPAVAQPRQIAMLLAHEIIGSGWAELGRVFKRDHTTILHGVRAARRMVAHDRKKAIKIAKLRLKLTAVFSIIEQEVVAQLEERLVTPSYPLGFKLDACK